MTEKNAQELLKQLQGNYTTTDSIAIYKLTEAVEYLLKKDIAQLSSMPVPQVSKPLNIDKGEPKPQTIQIKTETPKVEQTQTTGDTINKEEKPEKKYKLHYIIGRKNPVTKEIDVSDPSKTFDAYGNTTEEVLDFAQKYIDVHFPDWGKNWGGNLPESILK